ncbi:hypothetical protein WA026_022476 [Henosepilachna vigintioctopunctata]|uniref:Uncharacterized protein n=1 Tax=Henosepilachna vigintioctopunctata TaxID=420089 RepID=A0AAW1TYH9_9CUCU
MSRCTCSKNFNLIGFAGLWYEIEKSPIDFEVGGSCTTKSFTPLPNEMYREVITQLVRESGQTRRFEGTDTLSGKPGEAKFIVNLNLGPGEIS